MGLQSHTIDVGEENITKNLVAQPCTNVYKRIADYKRVGDLVVYCKAVRRVAGYLDLDIGDREITALSMVHAWCKQFDKNGGPISKIIDWSGYTRNWQGQIKSGIKDCLTHGLLENINVQGGIRIGLTAKGISVFQALEEMSDRVIDEMNGLRQKPKGRHHENRIRSSK